MLRLVLSGCACAAVLGGCSAAAAPIDPNNDLHCFALSTAFAGLTRVNNAPPDQQLAAAHLEAWWGVKFDRVVAGMARDEISAELVPLARAMDADPQGAKAAYLACTRRAAADPGFSPFRARIRGGGRP